MSKTEHFAVVEQLGDKLAQVTAEARAVEDYVNYEIAFRWVTGLVPPYSESDRPLPAPRQRHKATSFTLKIFLFSPDASS